MSVGTLRLPNIHIRRIHPTMLNWHPVKENITEAVTKFEWTECPSHAVSPKATPQDYFMVRKLSFQKVIFP
jgi:hypothetical protein